MAAPGAPCSSRVRCGTIVGRREYRESVRILVVDNDGFLLLLHTRDPARPEIEWWELPGGGIEPGESPAEAAARELYEETGIVAAPTHELARLTVDVSFNHRDYRQFEMVFSLSTHRLAVRPAALDGDVEIAAHLGHRWYEPSHAFRLPNFYPPQLPSLYELAVEVLGIRRQPGAAGK